MNRSQNSFPLFKEFCENSEYLITYAYFLPIYTHMFHSSHIFVFGFWYFGHFSWVIFFPAFFRLAHLALQNVNKEFLHKFSKNPQIIPKEFSKKFPKNSQDFENITHVNFPIPYIALQGRKRFRACLLHAPILTENLKIRLLGKSEFVIFSRHQERKRLDY